MGGQALDLFAELSTKKNYRQVFEDLRDKARKDPHRLESKPVNKSFSLEWVLAAEDRIVSFLVRGIRSRSYFPGRSTMNEVFLDKKRRLYALSWPDKIAEAVLAQFIGSAVEPHLSMRVYSYRKKFSNHSALRDFADYIKRHKQENSPLYIIKRDVAKYADTVDASLLIEQLRTILGEQDDYVWALLKSFLQPEYYDSIKRLTTKMHLGLPVGFSLTVIGLNLYLSELDKTLEEIEGGFYCRYSDDILFAHPLPQVAIQANLKLEQILSSLGLRIKEEKLMDIVLSGKDHPKNLASEFKTLDSFDYLGFNIDTEGEIFLSQNKIQSIKSEFRRTAKLAFATNKKDKLPNEQLVDATIHSLNLCMDKRFRHPLLPLLLTCITNENKLKALDLWIAKLALRYVYGSGHDRVFRHQSLGSLREKGLRSLVHIRRLALRGK